MTRNFALAVLALTPDAEPRDSASLTPDSQRAMDLLHRLVGEWIHEGTPPGGTGVFRVRNIISKGPDGVSLTSQGWLGDANPMHAHSAALIRRSFDGSIRFENVSEAGDVASGRITLLDDDSLAWDWNVTSLSGQTDRFAVQMDFPADPDSYHFTLSRLVIDDHGVQTSQQLVAADFTRLERATEEVLRTTPSPAHPSGVAGGE